MRPMMAAILMILLGTSALRLSAQEQMTPHQSSAAVEVPAGAAPSGDNSATSGVPDGAATPAPGPGGGCAGCGGHACHPQGCFLRKLLIWATYCPKERIWSVANCCNSCQYKGVVPLYPFFLNPPCVEGSGVYPTFAPECYRGCNGCAAGAAQSHP